MSSSSSSSSEPEIVQKKTKDKKKVKITTPDEHGRNKGDNPDLGYKPPEGFVLMKDELEEGDFDWDAIKNDDNLELWVVRAPEGLKPKYLENLKLEGPSSSKTALVGSLDRKHTMYDVWSLGEDESEVVGGEELRSLSCLLPRHSKAGKLYQAPKPVARRLVISARPPLPTPPGTSPDTSPIVHQNPPRPRHPSELLKHRFMPLGALAPVDDSAEMDVDVLPVPKVSPHKSFKSHKSAEGAESGKKRRKGNAGSPKKAKKAKTAAS